MPQCSTVQAVRLPSAEARQPRNTWTKQCQPQSHTLPAMSWAVLLLLLLLEVPLKVVLHLCT